LKYIEAVIINLIAAFLFLAFAVRKSN